MLLYPNFYRNHGIRRLNQLVAPKINPLESFQFPRGSVWHFQGFGSEALCVGVDDFLLRNVPGAILVNNVTQLATTLGNPRQLYSTVGSLMSPFYRKNRRMRPVTSLAKQAGNENLLVIENYAVLSKLWRYAKTPMHDYNVWYNDQSTLWRRINEVTAALPTRQHFIVYNAPTVLPSLNLMQRGESSWSRSLLKFFNSPESLALLDLWKWLGDHRETSLMHGLTPQAINNTNLVWKAAGQWIVINLGYLDNWRKGVPEEAEEGDEHPIMGDGEQAGTVRDIDLQKRVLRLLMFLSEVRTDLGTNGAEATTAEPEVGLTTVSTHAVGKPRVVTGAVYTDDVLPPPKPNAKPVLVEPLHIEEDIPGISVSAAAVNQAVSKDVAALDQILADEDDDEGDVKTTPVQGTVIPPYHGKLPSLEDGIKLRAAQLAKIGALTGAEFRRMEKLATTYKSLPNPYGGEGTLESHAIIEPTLLTIKNAPKVPDLPTVFDKSMLSSAVHEFDSKYIEQVMPKDISNAVLAVQRAGVAVTGYQINEVVNAGNHYEEHTIKLTPLQGTRSSLRFRIPKVKPNGTFLAGGVQYRMRKQRGELPIRKVTKDQVALTSYYGKCYVVRGEKVVNNYAHWLQNQLVRLSEEPNGPITKPLISDVMVSDVVLPKDYTSVASRFRSFQANGVSFLWDYTKRTELLKGERARVEAFEGEADDPNRMVLVGRKGTDYVLMDRDSQLLLHKTTGQKTARESLGSLTDFLGIETKKAPKEVAEMTVSGKHIPVGIVLAYLLGWNGLLKLLGMPYRRQAAEQRVSLGADEFAIRFEDETFIFSRKHRAGALVLAGFDSYSDTIRHYSAHALDLKDTYYNILDDEGLGIRYLREMDLMSDMFIDPITLDLLKSLNDPTDFVGLVLKAVDMLTADWSPAETDMKFMRIKGYERMSGAVYNELVRSIRAHRSRPGQAGHPIEMAPFAIWQAITQDPAVSLVEESNPIHNLKEKEELTYSGTGGRSSRSMVKGTRVFHPNDMGVISEATKDSADVAITSFLTADPGLVSLRGITKGYTPGTVGPASLISTSALLAPAADRDD